MRLVRLWDTPGTARSGWESHLPILWDEWETAKGVYAVDLVRRRIESTPQPVHLAIVFYMNDLMDHTPDFRQKQLILEADGQRAVMPNYADPEWQRAYWDAIEAMAEAFSDHPNVASFWLATGLDQETTPIKVVNGVDWCVPAAQDLDPYAYLGFVSESCRRAADCWQTVPVYLEGLPAPGAYAGKNLRGQMLEAAKTAGVGLKINGLVAEDTQDAIGLGKLAGTQRYDGWRRFVNRAAEPGRLGTHGSPGEAYWMMMRCLAWDVDFLAVQESWQPHVEAALGWLPDGQRWILFRDWEFGEIWWDPEHGVAGEENPWFSFLTDDEKNRLEFQGGGFGFDRWYVDVVGHIDISDTSLPDGRYEVRIWHAVRSQEPEIESRMVEVLGGSFTLPAGEYHRIDLIMPQPGSDGVSLPYLPENDFAKTLQEHIVAVRWWIEEYVRQAEAGNNERAAEILYSLIKLDNGLLYRLERLSSDLG